MNYIDNACKKRALSNLHPALKLQEGSVVRTAGKECGETARWLKATTAEKGLPLPSKQTKIHPAGLVSPFVPVVYCYFVSVKLLCYSTQGGNDLTLWGWSYFGQDSFVSQLSYFLQLLSVTSSLYPSLSPKLQQEDWFKAFFRAPSIRFRLRNCSLAFVPRKHWICGAAANASHWAETEAGSL